MRRPILVAWLSMAMLAGCGGGADPEQFAADANAICKTRIDTIEKSASAAEQRPDSGSDIADAYEEELERLRDLSPPSEDEADYGEMLDLYEDGARSAREWADLREESQKATDRDAFAELVERSGQAMVANRRARTRGNRLAKDIGLETCGTALY